MEEPWKIYYDELHDRAEEIVEQEFNVEDDLREVAHEVYEATADRLHNQMDYGEGDALTLTKTFGRALKRWIEEGHYDWDDLMEKLETAQMDWESAHEVSTP